MTQQQLSSALLELAICIKENYTVEYESPGYYGALGMCADDIARLLIPEELRKQFLDLCKLEEE